MIYWFSVLGLFKMYMDEVYEYGLFFKGVDEYGIGGLLKKKEYMFFIIWNVFEKVFGDKIKFFEGESLELVFSYLYCV